jgi:hypothetical protein
MSKKNNRLSNDIFGLGVELCLAPINYLLRSLPYRAGVVASVACICVWSTPIMIAFSVVSNLVFLFEIAIKLLDKRCIL